MNLRKGISIVDFLETVSQCKGDVFYCTKEQNQLNLKSQLCQYIFTASFFRHNTPKEGSVICKIESDYILLAKYLE